MQSLRNRLQDALAARYTIEREIGRGGMAVVYLATDQKHHRQVALKVLHPELGAMLGTERFLREIATTARLHHPHILTVHDSGEADGLVFYTMPYADGESLRERLTREGQLTSAAVVRILRDILEALGHAHDLGIVHRDIKPENIMLAGRHAVLTDFGISKAVSGTLTAEALTATGTALGTPSYMAPEQTTSGTDVDHRADIYAVGVVAYELLVGDPPFRGTSQQILSGHATKVPTPLQFVRPEVPRPLADLIMRCLQKRAADRWQHAGDLLLRVEALDGDLASWTVQSPASSDDRDVTLTERTFRLTDAVCRKVDRAVLDPRMIGDVMTYLDNGVESEVLVCYLHGTGLDQRHFQSVLSQSPYRGIAPTLYGCEPASRRRVTLPLLAHTTLVRELIQDVVDRLRPAMTVVAGFSSGGDFAMEMLSTPDDRRIVDGVVAFDCNLSFETCFLTRALAEMRLDEPDELLAQLRAVGERIHSVAEWVDVHHYLVKILHKFRGDLVPLKRYAADVIAPFTDPGRDPFVEWFSAVSAAVPVVRCVFSDSAANNVAIDRIRLDNLDRGVLGPRYQPDCLVSEPGTEHFDLIAVELVRRNVEAAVDRLRQRVSH